MGTRKVLGSQGKEIVAKVYQRMKFEAEHGIMKLTDARWRTSQAVGVSESTITRILREERLASKSGATEIIFKSPLQRKRHRPKRNLDEFDMGTLRRTIMSFQADFKEPLTMKRLQEVLSVRMAFDGCRETLRRILKEAGYEWVDLDEGKKALVERHDIEMWRFKYLKQLKQYRDEGRYIVYADETCINLNTTKDKGLRFMVVHAGGNKGFIPNASLVFKATSTSGDYHDNMNHEDYKSWLIIQLLPNLPEGSVIVMDNAPYHNEGSGKLPNQDSTKQTMKTWLSEKKIPFEESLRKVELYDLILKNKDKFNSYEIDALIRSKGFEILRLPPYHPELNPLEEIWAVLKERIPKTDVTSNIVLIEAIIDNIDNVTWKNACRVVERSEKQYAHYYETDSDCIIYFNESVSDGEDSNDSNISE